MIRLFELPHREAQKLLGSGAPVHLSFTPVEYHGPHLPLCCDRLICQSVQAETIDRMEQQFPEWPTIVVDGFDLGVEPTSGPGSVDLRYPILRKMVTEICQALVDLGARRAVLSTFHGSAMHNLALQDGVNVFLKAGGEAIAPFHLVMEALMDVDHDRYRGAVAHIEDAELRAATLAGLSLDFHAGFFETSMALCHAAHCVSAARKDLAPCAAFGPTQPLRALAGLMGWCGAKAVAQEMRFSSKALGWPKLRPFPGYTGRPDLADAAAGRVFTDDLLGRYLTSIEDVFKHGKAPPKPVLRWAKFLSLGGRISSTKVPLKHVAKLGAGPEPGRSDG